jgi:phosphoglycolate phosphatase
MILKDAYIFDFDGTIANTFTDSLIAFNKALIEFDIPTIPISDLNNVSYQYFRNFVHNLANNSDKIPVEELQLSYKRNYLNGKNYHTELYPGMREVLETIQENDIPISICSNRDQDLLDCLVNKLLKGIEFFHVIGYRHGIPEKPDPYKINLIIRDSNVEKENVLYVGDRSADILTAENAQVPMALVTWGQNDDISRRCKIPLKLIDNPEDILKL